MPTAGLGMWVIVRYVITPYGIDDGWMDGLNYLSNRVCLYRLFLLLSFFSPFMPACIVLSHKTSVHHCHHRFYHSSLEGIGDVLALFFLCWLVLSYPLLPNAAI